MELLEPSQVQGASGTAGSLLGQVLKVPQFPALEAQLHLESRIAQLTEAGSQSMEGIEDILGC